jgi:hypothetical protein
MFMPHTQISGRYSELIATAAFVAEGKQVALPYGNQEDWDLLVQEAGREWLRVQSLDCRNPLMLLGR